MTTFDDLVTEVRATLRGFGLIREQVAFLSSSITSSALTITVDDASGFQPGVVEIGSESIYVKSIAGNVLTVAPDGRGWDGTTAAAASANARVTADPPFPTWRIQRAINDTILGVFPNLFGVGTTTFQFNPSVTTYSLPADAEKVLSVSATVLGPSKDQASIDRYLFNSNADATEFPTGNCLTLREVPNPGRTVTVSYAKAPTELAAGAAFTDSGLRETARRCIVYGAVAQILSFLDASRASVDSAVATEFAGTNRVGTATQLSAQMTARYQLELNEEQRRLRLAHPPKVRFGGR